MMDAMQVVSTVVFSVMPNSSTIAVKTCSKQCDQPFATMLNHKQANLMLMLNTWCTV